MKNLEFDGVETLAVALVAEKLSVSEPIGRYLWIIIINKNGYYFVLQNGFLRIVSRSSERLKSTS